MSSASPEQIICRNLDEIKEKALEGVKKNLLTVMLFEGSSDDKTGESWCSDCRKAEPIIEECLQNAKPETLVLFAEIGQKAEYTPENPFCKDPFIKLERIPCMIRLLPNITELKEDFRIVEKECCDKEKVMKILS